MSANFSVVLEHVLTWVGYLLTTTLPVLGAWLTWVLHNKFKLDLSESQEGMLNQIMLSGVAYADQWAIGKLKENVPVGGADKMEQAISFVEAEISRLGLDVMARDGIKAFLEARLNLLQGGSRIMRASIPNPPVTSQGK